MRRPLPSEGRVLVSACLAGRACAYDGSHRANAVILDLVRSGRAVLVCPEEEGGLGTPRPAAEISGSRVITDEGRDVTAEYLQGARIAVERASDYDCRVAILKARSPACGCGAVYDGSFTGKIVEGDGVTAAALREAGLDLWTEEDVSA